MKTNRRFFLVVVATFFVVAGSLLTSAHAADADLRRHARSRIVVAGPHAPFFVAGPRSRSVITPYYFGYYPSHYSYNSPGPVFYRLDYPYPHDSCWLWRYNYLNWIC